MLFEPAKLGSFDVSLSVKGRLLFLLFDEYIAFSGGEGPAWFFQIFRIIDPVRDGLGKDLRGERTCHGGGAGRELRLLEDAEWPVPEHGSGAGEPLDELCAAVRADVEEGQVARVLTAPHAADLAGGTGPVTGDKIRGKHPLHAALATLLHQSREVREVIMLYP